MKIDLFMNSKCVKFCISSKKGKNRDFSFVEVLKAEISKQIYANIKIKTKFILIPLQKEKNIYLELLLQFIFLILHILSTEDNE